MNLHLLTVILIGFSFSVKSQEFPEIIEEKTSEFEYIKPTRIDLNDTVIFNMSKAIVNGGFIDIPISIKADDDIVALDFALQFDEKNLEFNSIINHTGYITANYFLYPSTLTLRLSSSSLTRYDKDSTKLLSLHFKMLSPKLLCADLRSIDIWLNGDPCSYKLVCPDGTVFVGNNNISEKNKVLVYPNPATEQFIIESAESAKAEIFAINGKKLIHQSTLSPNQKNKIDITGFTNGLYLIRIYNEHFIITRTLFINQ